MIYNVDQQGGVVFLVWLLWLYFQGKFVLSFLQSGGVGLYH